MSKEDLVQRWKRFQEDFPGPYVSVTFSEDDSTPHAQYADRYNIVPVLVTIPERQTNLFRTRVRQRFPDAATHVRQVGGRVEATLMQEGRGYGPWWFCFGYSAYAVVPNEDLVELMTWLAPAMEEENRPAVCHLLASEGAAGLSTQSFELPPSSDLPLSLTYGEKFLDVHKEFVRLLKDETQGLFLLHGPPGTGKTTYIRRLIREIGEAKMAIYIPKSVFPSLVGADLVPLMLELARQKPPVLILEDAESILTSREAGDLGDATALLLNLTDGILNNACKTQVVATFNTDLKSLDKALLRKGRLRKSWHMDALSAKDARALLKHLGKDESVVKGPMTLAELLCDGGDPEAAGQKTILGFGRATT